MENNQQKINEFKDYIYGYNIGKKIYLNDYNKIIYFAKLKKIKNKKHFFNGYLNSQGLSIERFNLFDTLKFEEDNKAQI